MNLKEYRLARGISQQQLAAELDVSQSRISQWESGIGNPSLDRAIQIAAKTGGAVSVTECAKPRQIVADHLGDRAA